MVVAAERRVLTSTLDDPEALAPDDPEGNARSQFPAPRVRARSVEVGVGVEDVLEELLEAWRGGDRRAGEQLFERHYAAVSRFFRKKLEFGVDDLIQRSFLACVEAASGSAETPASAPTCSRSPASCWASTTVASGATTLASTSASPRSTTWPPRPAWWWPSTASSACCSRPCDGSRSTTSSSSSSTTGRSGRRRTVPDRDRPRRERQPSPIARLGAVPS